MPRPPAPHPRNCPKVVFRVSPAEKAELDSLAAQLGLTVSDLIRQSLEYRRQQVEPAKP